MSSERAKFMDNVFLSSAIMAAFQRSKTYSYVAEKDDKFESRKLKFRKELERRLTELAKETGVTDYVGLSDGVEVAEVARPTVVGNDR